MGGNSSLSFESEDPGECDACRLASGFCVCRRLTACGSVDEPITPTQDIADLIGNDVVDAANVCSNWSSPNYHPWWDTLIIEVGAGSAIGADVVRMNCVPL